MPKVGVDRRKSAVKIRMEYTPKMVHFWYTPNFVNLRFFTSLDHENLVLQGSDSAIDSNSTAYNSKLAVGILLVPRQGNKS